MSGPSGTSEPRRETLLFFGIVPFGSMRQRPHHFALALARRFEVVYIEPNRSFAGAALERRGRVAGSLADASDEGLHLLDAEPMLPLSGYLPPLNALNYARVAAGVRAFLGIRGLHAPRVIVATFPKHFDALRHFSGVPVVYDVMDDYPAFFDRWQARVLEGMHRRLLRAAARVTVSSKALEERSRGDAPTLELIGNGVEEEFVLACRDAVPDPEVAAFPAPRLGCLGTLGAWIDLETIRAIASAFPHATIVLAGPAVRRLPPLPRNVRAIGTLPRHRIPGVLAAFDVGLVPFRRSRLTDAVNPLKLYEYFAAGLPVLATDLEGLHAWRGQIALCATRDEWIAAVRRELELAGDPASRGARREIAARHHWSDLTAAFVRVVERGMAA